MGSIYKPTGMTTYFDRVFNLMMRLYLKPKRFDTNHASRMPGSYNYEDNARAPRSLEGTNEFAHPSVCIRYIYSGFGLDDKHVWNCDALIGKGSYQLRYNSSSIKPRPGRQQHESKSEYQCVAGVVIPYYGKPPSNRRNPRSANWSASSSPTGSKLRLIMQ